MNNLTVQFRSDSPDVFSRWELLPEFSHGLAHPADTPLGNRYYAATIDAAVDRSFALVLGDMPVMLVRCNLLNGHLGNYSRPISLLISSAVDPDGNRRLIGEALKALDGIASQGTVSVSLREDIAGSALSPLGAACVSRGAVPQLLQVGQCDLSLEQKKIHSSLRKSFRSLVNWGRKNLSIEYYNARNPDSGMFERYREFHAAVAGRITRSDESWQSMRDWVLESGGEIALAHLGERLVAGTMTVDGAQTAVYASGVYDRTLFEKPLAHFPLYDAILRSRERGLKYYELGDLPSRGTVTDKEYNIGFFKRGFATGVQIHVVWTWQAKWSLESMW
ncbi:GNAT family N-acetyltransferase [Afipia broomeae]|uniref:Uncharacterized protein n=1 Tax=Afipia broomeae ATCC 49717 TaxID=883078 RepID=K8P4G9_9BRAD|nr:GNAT family N-acetyltransferase [Afipia broomeae]EKS36381.1 hypothetical protein HMPREF9695_02799 [Afipia broomeae ATCC 49717]